MSLPSQQNQLNYECKEGKLENVKDLISRGANINIYNYHYMKSFRGTPIMIASMYGQLKIVKYLVSVGAQIGTSFNLATEYGHIEIVKYLLHICENKLDLVQFDYVLDCTIKIAARNYKFEIVKYLVIKYPHLADKAVFFTNNSTYQPSQSRIKILKFLINHCGADIAQTFFGFKKTMCKNNELLKQNWYIQALLKYTKTNKFDNVYGAKRIHKILKKQREINKKTQTILDNCLTTVLGEIIIGYI